ncbi:hypothetical protein [Saccharothrix syringae]|uniref:Uncharacterized protein n=1 Tax=Saccharothrix syringae TaxID=103733 RepID=A0A5Q0H2N6_SACSY|nr:hypothetical protein [Saccharothrix syringae]QFZ20373.1 hypothetical protein EKG83_25770 [Saccharothrix syringae]
MELLGRAVGILTPRMENVVEPAEQPDTSHQAPHVYGHCDRYDELRAHRDVLGQIGIAVATSSDIALRVAESVGSRHQVEDARNLRAQFEQLYAHEVFHRFVAALGGSGTDYPQASSPMLTPVVPLLRAFHGSAERLCFSLEHRVALMRANSENRPDPDSRLPET